ncbi:hypothetical protein HYDPIDRAFT_135366 [Hydnomerulius pinastri MD-312]|uniref:Carbohydrate kinase PfkB domain-containing protein n=1 Tax=Hydnomerulius pinastri MD-312 TaxID=994086 RepID=A0A0C9W726_9AGAM|nr:hypothetical protein HYDPIDRAFT_135366 [Hydnomerulius pinastri MD-312]
MARLRRDTIMMPPPAHTPLVSKPLRIFSTGTIFLTHTLVLPSYPGPGSASRAQTVHTSRGGAAGHILALLAQLTGHILALLAQLSATSPSSGDVEPMLIASLGGNADALRLRDALETSGVRTKYCKLQPGLGIPSAWVMHARDTGERTVINHNPLPEVSHDDFIALLGPVLAPENYVGLNLPQPSPNGTGISREHQSSSPAPVFPNALAPAAPRPSVSSRPNTSSSTGTTAPPAPHTFMVPSQSSHSPAPFDWLHFEGRSVRTTLANVMGVDGLARERKWRSHCVISVDLGRRAREGAETLIPHADVIFLCTTTFPSLSSATQPGYSTSPTPQPNSTPTPRAILLSLARHAPPHALLVLNAGQGGAALLSLPTREYLQSSGWAPPPPSQSSRIRSPRPHPSNHAHTDSNATSTNATRTTRTWDGVESVRSGSEFWAGAAPGDESLASRDSEYTNREVGVEGQTGRSHRRRPSGESFHPMDDEDDEPEGGEDGRHTPQPHQRLPMVEEDALDEEGAHAAFVAGMIWALSRRVMPGPPYVPGGGSDGETKKDGAAGDLGVRWRLDECLRFATELAGRKAHIQPNNKWDGLGEDMRRAGWFD